MPWFKCQNKKKSKLIVARDIKQAEYLSREYLGLPYAECQPYEYQPHAPGERKKKMVRAW